MNVNINFLPRWARISVYGVFVLASLGLGAVAAWHEALGTSAPYWHSGASAVLAYLVAALGLVALANLSPKAVEGDTFVDIEEWDDDEDSDFLYG